MRIGILFGLLLAAAQIISPISSVAAELPYQITNYDIKVSLDSSRSHLQVTAVLGLDLTHPVDSLSLIFSSSIGNATVNDLSGKINGELVHRWVGKDSLVIDLPTVLATDHQLKLAFEYQYQLPGAGQAAVMLDRGYRWYPMILDNVAIVRLSAELPDSTIGFAAGDLKIEQTKPGMTRYVWQTQIPIFKIALVIANRSIYHEYRARRDSFEVLLYALSVDSGWQAVCDEAAKEIEWFDQTIGRYPHTTFAIVETPGMPGSDIASSLVMMGSEMLQPCLKQQFDALELVVAAQWFGAGIFGKFMQPGFWFTTLSLPHHARFLYQRATYGEERYQRSLEQSMTKYREFAGTDRDISIMAVDFPTSLEKGTVIYAKGPFLLERARALTDDDGWMRFLGTLWREYKGKAVTTDQMMTLLEAESQVAAEQLRRELSETGIPDQK